ncbi:YraN family protein [Hyphomicrobium sp.]|uniref:YraN family protein n=1 Tax=Hyphomicrobium sp. TaxID=82 RepID=UPI002FDD817C
MQGRRATTEERRNLRRARNRSGLRAEWIAALALRLRGYRILERRVKTPVGEIDLIALRGRRLAFVEVKRRASWEAAEAAITATQRTRIRRAAGLWLARNAHYQSCEQAFDILFLVGRRWPRYLPNAL